MKKYKIFIIPLSVICFCSFLVVLPGVMTGWPVTHEVFRYVHLLNHFTETFQSGVLYPRWLPDLFGGYGYPTFVFYQPGIFFIALPFRLITGNAFSALHITVFLAVFLGGSGIYFLSKKLTDNIFLSLFAAVFYLLTPYICLDLYVRGNLSELVAMQLSPWPLFFMLIIRKRVSLKEKSSLYVGLLTLFLTAIIYTHPAVSLFYFPLFFVFCMTLFMRKGNKDYLFPVYCLFSVILSIILSSPYWYPAMSLKKYVSPERALGEYYMIENHFVYFPQFFSNKWGFGESLKGMANDGISFQLGIFHFTAAVAGIIIGRKNKFILTSGILYFFLIFMMTDYSGFIWQSIPILKYVQFPWRILSITALLQIICLCGISEFKIKPLYIRIIAGVYLCAALIFHIDQFFCESWNGECEILLAKEENSIRNSYHPLCSNNEMLPKTVKVKPPPPRTEKKNIVTAVGKAATENISDSVNFINYHLILFEKSDIVINQIYLPGWKVFVNGKQIKNELLENQLLDDGRIKLELPKGEHNLYACYSGPPGYFFRNILIIISLIAYLIFCKKEKALLKLRHDNESETSRETSR